jgi:hypothetical protein
MVATTDHRGCSQKLIATLMMALYGEDVDIELLEQQAAAAASNSNGAERSLSARILVRAAKI